MEPLKILQVMRAPVGGLFRHVADLTHALSARGHAVGLVVDSGSGDARTREKLAQLAPAASLGIHAFPIPRLLGPADITTPVRIRRLAGTLGVSILHGHGAKGGFGARLASIGNPATVALYTPHGGALHFDKSKPAGAAFMAIERLLLKATDALIFESAFAREEFARKVAAPNCRNAVIHNGLLPAEFEPVSRIAEPADFVFIGELRLLKGIDLLIDALAPLRRQDGTPATLVIAGDGPDAALLREKAAPLGERIRFVGVQPARSMFAQGRCVVVPSRAESLPYIVLEAAAAAKPLIATRVGGIPEIFGPGSNALIPADDNAALQQAMAAYLANPATLETAATDRQSHVRERFSVEVMANAIESLYRALLAGPSKT